MTPLARTQSRIAAIQASLHAERKRRAEVYARMVESCRAMNANRVPRPRPKRHANRGLKLCQECQHYHLPPLLSGCCVTCYIELTTPARRDQ